MPVMSWVLVVWIVSGEVLGWTLAQEYWLVAWLVSVVLSNRLPVWLKAGVLRR